MGTIFYDRQNGNLVEGRIWQWCSPDLGNLDCVYADVSEWKTEDVCNCPIDKRHVTDVYTTEVAVDLLGGSRLADFAPAWLVGPFIVSENFAKRLRGSKLTGYTLRSLIKLLTNQTDITNPSLTYLQITGKGGFDRRLKVRDAPNLCPHCGHEPVICPACGILQRKCLHCGQETVYAPDGPAVSEKAFRLEGYPPDSPVVEAEEWDGSDWFICGGVPFISNRTKEWLEDVYANPIEIGLASLNIQSPRSPK